MDIQIFNANHAREITENSDGAFQKLVNEAWADIKKACDSGQYQCEFEYKAEYTYLIGRFNILLKEANYEVQLMPYRRMLIDWNLSMEEQLIRESEVPNV